MSLCWLFYANLIQARVILKEEISIEKIPPYNPAVGHFLNYDRCGRAQPIIADAIVGLVIPVSLRKQAEQGIRDKLVNSSSQWPLLQLLLLGWCPI